MPHGAIPFPFGDCRICQDKATGVHYGVATCEGCKGFFKRSIPKAEKYKCFFGGQCVLSPKNRNRCKSCRFKQCLEMGMSVEAVKMGRIPKLEKERALQTAKEIQLSQKPGEVVLDTSDTGAPSEPIAGALNINISAAPDSGIDSNENSPHYSPLCGSSVPLTSNSLNIKTESRPQPQPQTLSDEQRQLTDSRPNSSGSADSRSFYSSVLSSPVVIKQLLNHVLEADPNTQTEVFQKLLLSQANSTAGSHYDNDVGQPNNVVRNTNNTAAWDSQPLSQPGTGQYRMPNKWSSYRPQQRDFSPLNNVEGFPGKRPRYNEPVANIHLENGSNPRLDNPVNMFQFPSTLQSHESRHDDNGYSHGGRTDDLSGPVKIKVEPEYDKRDLCKTRMHFEAHNNVSGWSLRQIDRYLNDCVNGQSSEPQKPFTYKNTDQLASYGQQVVHVRQDGPHLPSFSSGFGPQNDRDYSCSTSGSEPPTSYINKGNNVLPSDILGENMESLLVSMDPSSSIFSNASNNTDSTSELTTTGVIPDIDDDSDFILEYLAKNYLKSFTEYVKARDVLYSQLKTNTHLDEINTLMKRKATKSEIVDVYQELISSVSPTSALMAEFCVALPGFDTINPEDKTVAIKESFFDLWMIGASACFHEGESHILLPNNKKYCMYWMQHFLTKELINSMLEFAQIFNSCQLQENELALVCAIRATDPEREHITNKEPFKKLQNRYLNLLTRAITRQHQDSAGMILSKLFSILPWLNNITLLQYKMIGNFKVDKVPEDMADTV